MNTVQLVTTGNQQEYLKKFLIQSARGIFPEAAQEQKDSFEKNLAPLAAGEKITVHATTYQELHKLNGLSCPVGGKEIHCNLAIPNFLADRLGLEPIGHELGLEVFGQGLHHSTLPQVEHRFVVCTIRCDLQPCRWDSERQLSLSNPYFADAIRLENKKGGYVQLYPTSHVARSSDGFLYLYKEKTGH